MLSLESLESKDWCDPSSVQPRAGMTQARQWTLDGVGNWSQVAT